jgi:peptidoglycan/LPS O-acetylase OafA/YrhL
MQHIGLGGWRFFLSFLVAISHLYGSMIHGPAAYAVWGFYVLSGYLMTYIINERYGDHPGGLKKYARNRFLRIYPLYGLAFVLGVCTIELLQPNGIDLRRLNPEFFRPGSLREWLVAASLLPMLPKGGLPVPVSSALAIEVGFYLLIAVFATHRRGVWGAFVMALLLNLEIGIRTETFAQRYATFLPTLVAFLAGSLVYHHRDQLRKFALPRLSMLVWVLHCLVWLKYDSWPWRSGLYLSVVLSAWVVVSLCEVREGALSNLLGEMSYPVYLFHTTVGAWFLGYFGYERPFGFFLVSFGLTLILSYLVIVWIDRPLHRLKVSVRPAPTSAPPPSARD